ncbi:hypothetical protein KEH51_19450 [[Brevibacterium] frigoritolerans]|uniref:Alpha-amylase SusG-like C-terminal domain-containing protein n=1 Tax=Peribacillus frigoritolerans TaxID=450367 RepID=A0A941FIP4_9BACI|nr:hypothetical protein [Peribacillus frigoritolerans]
MFAYIRSYENEKLLVINNFYAKKRPSKYQMISTYQVQLRAPALKLYRFEKELAGDFILRPYESVVYLLKKDE